MTIISNKKNSTLSQKLANQTKNASDKLYIITNYSTLTKEQFDNEIQMGISDFDRNNILTPEEVQTELLKRRKA
ncbi:hypothetical protein [Ligilactobacillus agilis]|uniref:hypothetical protein n=1 Tax=Ligilactobacillus agilis TaxID=1601 RepID=UPI000B8D8231|nr:hypothetical protein [Ligilactobacillus agilis]ASR40498.1 hypothetical protein BEN83_02885 [Ligilactobacillus agilis]GET19218.1 hypothetical protein PTL465_15360 [Ligilactobacillus agilis]